MPQSKAMDAGHQAEVILLEVLPATGVVADVAAKERQEAHSADSPKLGRMEHCFQLKKGHQDWTLLDQPSR
jgi:hypothetical protein